MSCHFWALGRALCKGKRQLITSSFCLGGQILFPSAYRKKNLIFLTLGLKGNKTYSLWRHASRYPSSTGHPPDALSCLKISLRSSLQALLLAHHTSLNSTLNQPFMTIYHHQFCTIRFPLVTVKPLNYSFSAYLHFKCWENVSENHTGIFFGCSWLTRH